MALYSQNKCFWGYEILWRINFEYDRITQSVELFPDELKN